MPIRRLFVPFAAVAAVSFVACTAGNAGKDAHATHGQDARATDARATAQLGASANPKSQIQNPKLGEKGPGVPEFWVRPGYKVTLAADLGVETRFMEFGTVKSPVDGKEQSVLYLSVPGAGRILTLKEESGVYKPMNVFVDGYRTVHGMHFFKGWLWFGQEGAIHKARDTNADGKADEIVTVIPDGKLPKGGHWWRPIFVADDGFYTEIGDSGNITDETETDRQKIWKYSLDGKSRTLFCSGLRNTEKLRYRPGTKEIWGADHGSDWFGGPLGDREGRQPVTDWNPPCEFNRYVQGGFFGHPFIVGNRVPRIEYQKRPDILALAEKTIVPEWNFGPHWAPNGWCFLAGSKAFPADHDGDAFVAMHGSWNSAAKVGYRVERVLFDDVTGKPYGSLMIVGTLGPKGEVLARPVDVVQAPDGSLLFSDDQGNRIYRVTRGKGEG